MLPLSLSYVLSGAEDQYKVSKVGAILQIDSK